MIRLDKYIAETEGLTRSQAGKTIRDGAVSVNGILIRKPEQKIDETRDVVICGGRTCRYRKFRYYLLNKPAGIITAARDAHQKTVLELLPPESRKQGIVPVGRLDKDTEGLLLLTNDGEFAHRVLSPKSELDKVYHAMVAGRLVPEDTSRFQNGLILADGTQCMPAKLQILGESECLVTVHEGKYHQVRRMLAAVGKPVLSLERIALGPLGPEHVPERGCYRELLDEELCILFKMLNM